MVTVNYMGRLGNNILQYVIGYIFSKKFNLHYKINPNIESSNILKPINITGNFCDNNEVEYITDENISMFLEKTSIPCKNYIINGFFQTQEISELIRTYKSELFNLDYEKKDGIFLHYRIGDIEHNMSPLSYYEKAINLLGSNNKIYISSDTPNHKNILKLCSKYDCEIVSLNPVETIKFGKNFKKIILSEGSFSFWVGFLSSDSEIIINKRDVRWAGHMPLKEWEVLNYN